MADIAPEQALQRGTAHAPAGVRALRGPAPGDRVRMRGVQDRPAPTRRASLDPQPHWRLPTTRPFVTNTIA